MSLVFSRSIADLAGTFAAPCFIIGALALALAIPVTFAVRGIVIHPDKVGGSFKSVLSMPIYLATIAIVLAYMLAEQGSTAFASLVAEERLSLSPVAAARTGALLWAGMILGRLLAAFPRKLKIELDILMCIGMMSFFGMLAVTTRTPWIFAACLLLTGVFGGPILALIATFQCQRLPANQSIALSLSAVATGVGGAAGPAFLGGLAHQLGIGKALGFSFMILPASGGVLVITLLLMMARITFSRAVPHLRVEIGRWKLLLSRDLGPSAELM
jgi:fucose permease